MKKILLFPLLAIWLSGCTTASPDAFSTDPLAPPDIVVPLAAADAFFLNQSHAASTAPSYSLKIKGQAVVPPLSEDIPLTLPDRDRPQFIPVNKDTTVYQIGGPPLRAPTPGPAFTAPGTNTNTNTTTIGRGDTGVLIGPRVVPLPPLTVEASRNLFLKWDAASNFVVGSAGVYQIAFTTTAATAASLGNGEVPLGALGTFNVAGTELRTKFGNFVPPTAAPGNYRVWARAIDNDGIRSDWSASLPVTWPLLPVIASGGPIPPASPVNQRAVLIP